MRVWRGARVAKIVSVLAVATAGALTGCATPAPQSPAANSEASSPAGLDSLASEIAARAPGRFPGAVFAVARGDKLLTLEAVGNAKAEGQAPMQTDSVFRLMSMTKPVTAVAAMLLVEEGRLKLDEPVAAYLPEFSNFGVAGAPALTARHLLTHSSGIGFGSLPSKPVTLANHVKEISARTMKVPAGREWAYSGVDGPDIVARIVEVLSGEPYEQFVRRRIFTPLGMVDTGYSLTAAQEKRLVGLYASREGAVVASPPMFPDATYPSGGAGLYSTVPDYIRFAQMLANDGRLGRIRILKPSSVQEMRSLQLPAGFQGLPAGTGWGLLMRIVADPVAAGSPLSAGAFGWSGAYGTHFWVDPTTGLTAVWMINLTTAGGAASPDAMAFEKLVTAACAQDRRCTGR